MKQPTLENNSNIFTYVRHLSNWFEFERVQQRHYSPMEQLTFAMEEMEKDSRFEKALSHLRVRQQMHKKFYSENPNISFPPSLRLEHLPTTIMQKIPTDERKTLFFNDEELDDNSDDNARIHSYQRPRNPYNNNN